MYTAKSTQGYLSALSSPAKLKIDLRTKIIKFFRTLREKIASHALDLFPRRPQFRCLIHPIDNLLRMYLIALHQVNRLHHIIQPLPTQPPNPRRLIFPHPHILPQLLHRPRQHLPRNPPRFLFLLRPRLVRKRSSIESTKHMDIPPNSPLNTMIGPHTSRGKDKGNRSAGFHDGFENCRFCSCAIECLLEGFSYGDAGADLGFDIRILVI
jgi:hypothetical protein